MTMKRILFIACVGLLAMPMAAQDIYRPSDGMLGDGTYERSENIRSARVPQTIAEAVAALPALPTVEQISSASAKQAYDASTYSPYKMAIEQVQLVQLRNDGALRARVDKAGAKQRQQNARTMQQYNSNVNAGLMPSQEEMMQLYMSGAITEDMSDEQMMDVMAAKNAQKWGISKQEYIKIINMSQTNPKQAEAYLKASHPQLYQRLYAANAGYDAREVADDPRDARFAAIGEELVSLQEQMMNAINKYGNGVNYANPGVCGRAIDRLMDDLRAEWPKSAEAKQIDAIETQLWKRVEEWERTLNVYDGEVTYPAWWTAERKKENALIDQWNRRTAQRWLAAAADEEKELKGIMAQIGKLETENEQLGQQGDTENMIYLQNKLRLNTLYGQLLWLTIPMQDALNFPCIEHVEETGTASLGKG